MFGCLRRLGCLVVLLIGAALYVGREYWWPRAREVVGGAPPPAPAAVEETWEALDHGKAQRGEQAVRELASRSGPVFVNLRGGELASYVFLSLNDALPEPLRRSEAAVLGDRIYLRAEVSARDLGGMAGGMAETLIPDRDTLRLGGTLEVVRPGLAELRIREVRIGRLPVPSALVPRLLAPLRRGAAVQEVAEDAIAVPLPPYIGDVRVGRGRITLYRTGER